jgi:hypothetical protein
VAVDAADNIIIGGHLGSDADFGGGKGGHDGGDDAFVAKFDGAGNHQWSYSWGDDADQRVMGIATGAGNSVHLVGWMEGDADFGGGTLSSAGSEDVFAAKLGANGAHQWSRRFGNAESQMGTGVAVDAAGDTWLVGSFFGSIGFGAGALVSAGGADGFVANLGTGGVHLSSATLSGSGANVLEDVALSGAVAAVVGSFHGNASLAGEPDMSASGGADFLAARLMP